MNHLTFDQLGEIVSTNSTFAILSHLNPDGDAIGSVVALNEILNSLGKTTFARNQDGVPEALSFLPGSSVITTPCGEKQTVDVLFALDCAKEARLGSSTLAEFDAKVVVNIDHHKTNTLYGDYHYIDSSAASTTQIIFELATHQEYELSEAARDNIYVGLSTDTDSFKTRGTSKRVHEIAAELIDQGLNVAKVNELTYETIPFRKVELLREYLNTLTLSSCKKIASWHLTLQTKNELGILPGDNEDMVNYMTSIDSVEVACSFEEIDDGSIRVSIRSGTSKVDASAIATSFGGGGHAKAAGIIFENETIERSREKVLTAVCSLLEGSLDYDLS